MTPLARLFRIFPLPIILVCLAILPGCEPEPTTPGPQETGYRYLGLIAPLSGPLASLGRSMQTGAELALTSANARPTNRERPFRLLVEDETAAIPEKRRLAADPRLDIIIGHAMEGTLEKAKGLYLRVGRPVLLPIVSSRQAPLLGEGLFFRLMPSDAAQAAALARHAREQLGIKHVLIIFEDSKFGYNQSGAFTKAFEATGPVRTWARPMPLEAGDLKTLVAETTQVRPEGIFLALHERDAFEVTNAFTMARIKTTYLSTHVLARGDLVAWMEQLPGRAFVTLPWGPEETREEAAVFNKQFQSLHHRPADWATILTHDAVLLAATAIEQVGEKPGSLRQYLNNLNGPPRVFHGLAGDYHFQPIGQGLGPIKILPVNAGLLGLLP